MLCARFFSSPSVLHFRAFISLLISEELRVYHIIYYIHTCTIVYSILKLSHHTRPFEDELRLIDWLTFQTLSTTVTLILFPTDTDLMVVFAGSGLSVSKG